MAECHKSVSQCPSSRTLAEGQATSSSSSEGDVVLSDQTIDLGSPNNRLGAIRPFGHSREAVWLSIVVATIVAVLMALCEQWRPKGVSRVSWMRALCTSFSMLRLSG